MRAAYAMLTGLSVLAPTTVASADDATAPRTVDEYDERKAELGAALRAASSAHEAAAVADLRAKTMALRVWRREHVHRENPGIFAAGVTMLSVGDAALAGGVVVFFAGLLSNCQPDLFFPTCHGNTTLTFAGTAMMLGGAIVALGSIPVLVVGDRQTVDGAPRAAFVVGPARVGLSVSF